MLSQAEGEATVDVAPRSAGAGATLVRGGAGSDEGHDEGDHAHKGRWNFSGLVVEQRPGATVTLELRLKVTADSPVASVAGATVDLGGAALNVTLRRCVAGEVYVYDYEGSGSDADAVAVARACTACSEGSYSWSPDWSACAACPTGATCPGGAALVVKVTRVESV